LWSHRLHLPDGLAAIGLPSATPSSTEASQANTGAVPLGLLAVERERHSSLPPTAVEPPTDPTEEGL
jgi:hypothetical protein